MPALALPQSRLFLRNPLPRSRFVSRMNVLLGGAIVGGWLPQANDTTTSICPWTGKVWTADASMTLVQQGKGKSRAFASASTQYMSTPDAANLSFGNGATDVAMTLLVLANVTDTAANRALVAKLQTSNQEYRFYVTAADLLAISLFDESAAVQLLMVSNAAITQGAWGLFGMSYSGAPPATNIGLYQNGTSVASTPTTDAGYVAMENLAAPAEIGAYLTHTSGLLDGSIAMIVVAQTNLLADGHAQAAALCRQFFRVAL